MIPWIKSLFSKKEDRVEELEKKVKDLDSKIKKITLEISSISFLLRKQSELIAAIAAIQGDILYAINSETSLYESLSDSDIEKKIILSLPDDDDIFH